jgi:hypothetical protein
MSEASGMVTVQAHCSFTEAAALMKERARVSHHSLDRSIRFGI